MAYRLAQHPITMLGLVCLVALIAFVTVDRLLATKPEMPSVSVPTILESSSERTDRLGKEQSAKEWSAAQKRADARNQRATRGADGSPGPPK